MKLLNMNFITFFNCKANKYKGLLSAAIYSLMVLGCTTSKQFTQLNTEAKTAYTTKDYETALVKYDSLIALKKEKGKKVSGKVYNYAGLAAFNADNTSKTITYLQQALHDSAATADAYYALARSYKKIDNLSKEINNLQAYVKKFPDGKDIISVRKRLFETLVESENYDQALGLWKNMTSESKSSEEMLTDYLILNRELNNNDTCDEVANKLLDINKDNKEALDWLARKYFWKAENLYQDEMKAYKAHRTRKQYAHLLKALKIVNKDFDRALKYFKRLYNLEPSKEYAKFIGNIYRRFDNKQKADYYLEKAGK
ncbi:MAG TPA: hypothetical protein VE912_23040 [Bacteroidales bacterium]|nr:hypothetical protein [Bacteroidales bacterium]